MNLPLYIPLIFSATVCLTLYLFLRATPHARTFLFISIAWLSLQGLIAASDFYTTITLPPRFLFAVLPPLFTIILFFILPGGRRYLDKLDLRTLTLLHIIRIPVELVLLWLSVQKVVPELMTFEGINFDILSGISAPFIYYFGFVKRKLPSGIILLWNFICLALLFHIVTIAVLSAPFPFQQLAFDQPNVAIFHFPYIWLPCFIVPLVLLAHLVAIRKLLKRKQH